MAKTCEYPSCEVDLAHTSYNSQCVASSGGSNSGAVNAKIGLQITKDGISNAFVTNTTQIAVNFDDPSGSLESMQKTYDKGCPLVDNTDNFWPLPEGTQPVQSYKYLGGRDIQFYKLDKEGVGAIYIPTFETEGGNTCQERFILDVARGIQNFTQAGITKVVIDTSNNGGGYISLTQFLQRAMTGTKFLAENNFDTLFAKTDLSEAMAKAYIAQPRLQSSGGSWAPTQLRKWGTTQDLSRYQNYFEPGKQMNINGHTLYTSNDVSDSVDDVISNARLLGLGDDAPFKPENIYFIGNGLCGSSCASFTNHMIEYYNGQAYINNPDPSKPVDFQAFAAAQVYDANSVRGEADYVGLSDDKLIPPTDSTSYIHFAFRGGVSPNTAPGKFLQYRTFPAQHTYSLGQAQWESPIENWEYVAEQVF